MQDIIAELRRRQGRQSQRAFAAELGISQTTLWRLYHGRRIGPRPARQIARRFPELQLAIALFLLGGDIPTDGQ